MQRKYLNSTLQWYCLEGLFLACSAWGAWHLDAQVPGCWHSYHTCRNHISAAKSGACYLSSLAPETFGAWCGSLKVKKVSTAVRIWQHRFDLQWILFSHCRFKLSFIKCSGTEFVRRLKTHKPGKDFSPQAAMTQRESCNWCVTVPVSCSCISKSYMRRQQ